MERVEAAVRPERPELLAASDAVIEDAVAYAEPMILRGLLYQLTGDPELKAMPVRPTRRNCGPIASPSNTCRRRPRRSSLSTT